jgi:hypothetical protein
VNDWLAARADALSERSGLDRAAFELSAEEIEALLELAGHAAHSSGARTNAPLLCYLVGLARANGTPLDALDETVRSTS